MLKHKVLIALIFGIVVLFFFSRLYNIMSLPIFTDEAIYVRWAQIAKNDANWRFISLVDGKQPSFVWLTMVGMRFVEEPLLAGRLVSAGAGFATLIGLFFLGREIFKNTWIGIASSFMYLIYPMALVYDRMALYESLVGAFAVWSLYLGVLLVRRLNLSLALLLGMVAGGGVLTKTSGFFSIYLLPSLLLLFSFSSKDSFKRLLKLLSLAILSIILTYGFYSILRLSPFFNIIKEKNALFVYPFDEWLTHPFNFFYGNMRGVWDWYITYNTWPIFVLTVGAFFINRGYFKEKLLLVIWFIIPFVALALFGRTLYPRFIFFMTLFLLPLAAYSFFQLQKLIRSRILFVFCFLPFVFLPIRSDYYILTNFAEAPIPDSDLGQYNNDWPAGGGIKEAVIFFEKQAEKEKIFVGTQGTFGLMPFALEIYLGTNPNIEIVGLWPIGENPPKKLIEKSRIMPTFVVFYQPCDSCEKVGLAPDSWPLTLVAKYEKPAPARFFSIYQVNSR